MKLDSLMIWASGHFLTEPLPSNYQDLPEQEFEEFISEHVWEPFENYETSEILEMIENLAEDVAQLLKNQ